MFVWPIAAKDPSAIEAIEMKTITWRHCALDAGEGGGDVTRTVTATAAIFTAVAKKAVTGVGAPS